MLSEQGAELHMESIQELSGCTTLPEAVTMLVRPIKLAQLPNCRRQEPNSQHRLEQRGLCLCCL